ncbi:MAG: GNAT family N-acetyltransferase [Dehalococcoidales bacterium]|jgi:L-amino acid N-acyltransferase YncA
MKIRNAAEKDISEIAALSARFTNEVPTWGQAALTEEQVRRLDMRLVWVAEDAGKITGYAVCLPHENDGGCIYKDNDKILELGEIYLVPEARGKGVGSLLLKTINDDALKAGYTKLLVYSSVKELDPVVKFYRGGGFRTWGIQMFKEIE